jgi:DNA repair exonuclease SbcCD nuclease subunit
VVRFLHTADWQLGLKLAFIPGDHGAIARHERFEVVRRIGAIAKERGAGAIVVAGDVFDDNRVGQATLQRARDALSEMAPTPVLLLPGNHDAGGPDCVLRRLDAGSHVRPLLDRSPVDVAGVRFYPCPLLRRHERDDPTSHLPARADDGADAVRVAVAHGGLLDFGEGESHNRIDWLAVLAKGFDYLALGDWHGTLRFGDSGRVYYAGTPEPTRFKERRPGYVLLVSIEGPGAAPVVEEIEVRRTTWIERSVALEDDAHVEPLLAWLRALPTKSRTLVDLTLTGALSPSARVRLDAGLDDARGDLMLLRAHEGALADRPTDEDLARLSGDGLVGRAAAILRADPAPAARDALRLLHRFVLEDQLAHERARDGSAGSAGSADSADRGGGA